MPIVAKGPTVPIIDVFEEPIYFIDPATKKEGITVEKTAIINDQK